MTVLSPRVRFQDIAQIVADRDISEEEQDKFLDDCVAQLLADKAAYDSGAFEQVTDCAVFMPRPGGHLDKLYRTGHLLASKLSRGELGDPDENRIKTWELIIYKQLIARLSRVTRDRKKQLDAIRLRSRKNRRITCLLNNRNAPVSKDVIDPVPMPVEAAPLGDLQPVISALAHGSPVFPPESNMIEYKRGVIFSDGRLDLCKQVVGPQHIGKVMDALRDNTCISHFLLGNNITGMKGAEAVARFIAAEHRPAVKTWYLAGNEIDADGIALLAESLEKDTDVKSLWLKRNPLRPAGALAISNMLRVNGTLKVLDLLNTGLLDEGTATLFGNLHEAKALRSLYLDANGLTQVSAPTIASYFDRLADTERKGVTRLWIGMNRLGDDGAGLILNALTRYPFIRTLSLNSNRLTWRAGSMAFDAFRDHRKIRVLDLGMYKATVDMGEQGNNLGDHGGDFMARLVIENRSIQVLDLCENDISDEVMRKIINALQGNPSILSLGFSQFGKRYVKDIVTQATQLVRRNLNAQGLEATGPTVKQHLRHIIHGKRVDHIDSIYRNRAMKGGGGGM